MKRLIKVQFKRRRRHVTDYSARKSLLSSGLPRLVIRRSNRYLTAQLVEGKVAQDRVIFTANSKELLKYGWPSTKSIKNLQAGYLLGVLCAVKAKKAKVDKAIIDLGLQRSSKGNRLYAVVKGAIEGGLKVPHSKEILPTQKQLEGESLKTKVDLKKLMENINK